MPWAWAKSHYTGSSKIKLTLCSPALNWSNLLAGEQVAYWWWWSASNPLLQMSLGCLFAGRPPIGKEDRSILCLPVFCARAHTHTHTHTHTTQRNTHTCQPGASLDVAWRDSHLLSKFEQSASTPCPWMTGHCRRNFVCACNQVNTRIKVSWARDLRKTRLIECSACANHG